MQCNALNTFFLQDLVLFKGFVDLFNFFILALDDESLRGVPSMGRITGSASIETLVRVGLEKVKMINSNNLKMLNMILNTIFYFISTFEIH